MSGIDNYARSRARSRSGTRAEAMARLWEMAREGLAMRAQMGVRVLTYETDLIPGCRRVELVADPHGVTIVATGHKWGDTTTGHGPKMADPMTYRLDEAWLLTRADPLAG